MLPPLFGKPQLKNDILWLQGMSLGWLEDCVNTLGNALWYIHRNRETLSKRGCPVTLVLQQFGSYRFPEKQKKRKTDESYLKNGEIKVHSSALFNLGMVSYLKKDRWKSLHAAVFGLAESLQKYSAYLTSHAKCVRSFKYYL